MYSLWAFYQKREGSSEKVTRKPRLPFYTVELSSFSLHTELEALHCHKKYTSESDDLMWEVISKNAKHLALSNPMKMRWTCADPLWQKLFCGRVERRVLLVRVAALGREEGNFHKYFVIEQISLRLVFVKWAEMNNYWKVKLIDQEVWNMKVGHLVLLWVSHVAHVWAAQAERLSVPPPRLR